MKIIKDFKDYLDLLEPMAKKLPPEKRAEFVNILTVMLKLLIAMRQASNLGEISINWLYNKNRDKSFDDFYS